MEVMKEKVILSDEMVRIEDNWMRKEKTMQWRLEELAKRERRNNTGEWVRYGKIWMEGRWWNWQEEKGRLMDGMGQEREWREEEIEERGRRGG